MCNRTPLFWSERNDSGKNQSARQAAGESETAGAAAHPFSFSLGNRIPKDSNQPYRLKSSPAGGGAEAIAAPGGAGASIAQRYLLRSLQGITPDPNAACGRKIGGQGRKRSVDATEKI